MQSNGKAAGLIVNHFGKSYHFICGIINIAVLS